MKLTLATMRAYLDGYLGSSRFEKDQNGIYRASNRGVKRIGLAVEPWMGIGAWVRQERLDALFLHRPWQLHLHTLPEDVGILAYHLAFDAVLTFGFNPRLADVLRMKNPIPFAFKETVPQGMIGDIDPDTLSNVVTALADIFGTPPRIAGSHKQAIERIAVVGAMTESLIYAAANQGVQLYITGQLRERAMHAVDETGIIVAEIGHAVGEAWGIRALAGVLRERWATIEVLIQKGDA